MVSTWRDLLSSFVSSHSAHNSRITKLWSKMRGFAKISIHLPRLCGFNVIVMDDVWWRSSVVFKSISGNSCNSGLAAPIVEEFKKI